MHCSQSRNGVAQLDMAMALRADGSLAASEAAVPAKDHAKVCVVVVPAVLALMTVMAAAALAALAAVTVVVSTMVAFVVAVASMALVVAVVLTESRLR